jgi:thiosulfate/3-mercaptopyruvate sulfurtransferase
MTNMTFTTIISVQELKAMIDDPEVVICDVRFSLDDELWAKRAYLEGHIPGALQADLAEHLSGEIIDGVTGRRPFPDAQEFAAQLGRWGISPDTQVVVYDNEGGLMAASRLWLMLRWLGHDAVAVLDGGFPAWLAAGEPIETDVRIPIAGTFIPNVRPEMLADVTEVDDARVLETTCVFDSRGAEGYHGGGKYYDPVRGHIAGAGLADRAETMTSDGHIRSVDELRTHYSQLIGDQQPSDIIFYCGSGVTAAQNVLAMTHAGLTGSRMYVGSWSEWITDPRRPVEL